MSQIWHKMWNVLHFLIDMMKEWEVCPVSLSVCLSKLQNMLFLLGWRSQLICFQQCLHWMTRHKPSVFVSWTKYFYFHPHCGCCHHNKQAWSARFRLHDPSFWIKLSRGTSFSLHCHCEMLKTGVCLVWTRLNLSKVSTQ